LYKRFACFVGFLGNFTEQAKSAFRGHSPREQLKINSLNGKQLKEEIWLGQRPLYVLEIPIPMVTITKTESVSASMFVGLWFYRNY